MRCILVGFDFSDTIEKDLKAGVIQAVVVQDPFNIGYTDNHQDPLRCPTTGSTLATMKAFVKEGIIDPDLIR